MLSFNSYFEGIFWTFTPFMCHWEKVDRILICRPVAEHEVSYKITLYTNISLRPIQIIAITFTNVLTI